MGHHLFYLPELGLWTFRDRLRVNHLQWEEFPRENCMSFPNAVQREIAEREMYRCLSGVYLNTIKPLAPELRKFVAHLFV